MNVWIVEYSPLQEAFHVDTLDKVLAANRQSVERGITPGYIPLHIAATREDAHAFVKRWKHERPEGARA